MLFIDQERVVAQFDPKTRTWAPLRATVWLENSTGQAAVFSLTIRPKDAALRGDWYETSVHPTAVHVHAGQRGQFEVTLTVHRSPHGRNNLIEFQVVATQAGMAAGVAGAFEEAYSGQSKTTFAAPEPAAPSPPPTAGGGLQFYRAGESVRADVELIDLGATPVTATATSTAAAVGAGGPAAYAGQSGLEGSLVVFIPPIPEFELQLLPVRNPKSKKPAPQPDPSQPLTVAHRERGLFTLRVSNRAKHPAGFRLKAEGHEGSAFDLGDQYLHAGAGESVETTLTARPDGLSWWSLRRDFPFGVEVTPLTGATRTDEGGRRESQGVFRQTLAWLHPSTLVGVASLAALVWFLGLPRSLPAQLETEYVLQETADPDTRDNTGIILDAGLARQALTDLKIGLGGKLRIRVTSERDVFLEVRRESAGRPETRRGESGSGDRKTGRTWTFDFAHETTESQKWQVRAVERGILGRRRESEWQEVTVAPGARANLQVSPATPVVGTISGGESGSYPGARVRLLNPSTGANIDFLLVDTPEGVTQRQPPPGDAKNIAPGNQQAYDFQCDGEARTRGAIVTVVANAKNGLIRQFRIAGRP